jgi:hypothetical protein
MYKIRLIILAVILVSNANAQNIFPVKLNNCQTESFCLDCGDIKANVDSLKLQVLISQLIFDNDIERLSYRHMFQILVDSEGRGCVLSHTDTENTPLTKYIIKRLNSFSGWIPAIKKRKKVDKCSINMSFEISKGKVEGKIVRVNVKDLKFSR